MFAAWHHRTRWIAARPGALFALVGALTLVGCGGVTDASSTDQQLMKGVTGYTGSSSTSGGSSSGTTPTSTTSITTSSTVVTIVSTGGSTTSAVSGISTTTSTGTSTTSTTTTTATLTVSVVTGTASATYTATLPTYSLAYTFPKGSTSTVSYVLAPGSRLVAPDGTTATVMGDIPYPDATNPYAGILVNEGTQVYAPASKVSSFSAPVTAMFVPSTTPSINGFRANVSVLAGNSSGGWVSSDGTGTGAQFTGQTRITSDGSGGMYVSDAASLRHMNSARVVTTLFKQWTPYSWDGLTSDKVGNLYAAVGTSPSIGQYGSSVVRMAPGSTTPTLFISNWEISTDNGKVAAGGMAIDNSGNLYLADASRHRIIRFAADGKTITVLAGGTSGFADGKGSGAAFRSPHSLTVMPSGSLLVADTGNNAIRVVTSAGEVSTLIRVDQPRSIVVLPNGDVLFTVGMNKKLMRIAGGWLMQPAGDITGFYDQISSLAIDNTGNLTASTALSGGSIVRLSY